jgi:signal peptidase I
MNNLPGPGTLYRKFNVQELINMTLKKAYHTLITIFILTTIAVVLFALGVSKMALRWGIVGFVTAMAFALISLSYGIYSLKHEKTDDNAHILVRFRYEILDWLSFVGVSMMVIFIIFMFFFLTSTVSQSSMSPTLNAQDRILLYHFNYEPKRGDIVVLGITKADYPEVPIMSFYNRDTGKFQENIFFVKRIVALPGDTILFVNFDHGSNTYQISINGEISQTPTGDIYNVTESQIEQMSKSLEAGTNIVKSDVYFAFGDNASESFDSRSIGGFQKKDVLGIVVYRFWPMGRIS